MCVTIFAMTVSALISFLILYDHRQLALHFESQLNAHGVKNVRTDMVNVTEERDALLARAERAEKALEERGSHPMSQGRDDAGNMLNNHENKEYSDEMISLKENVLRLDSERAVLQNILSQREKKIELLEEDLRGPVPFESGR